jgi:CheY-like chemotaxis protein/anti-sigma regulatory factor (Ser/Thr protein kinase)
MFIARLGQLPMDEAMREVVRNLEASVLVMQDLLDGLLDLSRLEAGAVAVDVRPVHLGAVMQAVAAALRPLAEQKKLRLRVRPSLHWVLTDSMLIQRMLMNLGHNALRYTEQGSVLIAARRANAGKCIRIEVWDSGIGIAPEHQTDIFKEFYQVENSRRARPFGLGLGLNIVERSAQLLGHAVQVRSELGCGTRVSLTVEVAAAADLQASLTQPPAPETALADALVGVKVLVIEDDDFAREALSVLLGAWGCSVMAASSLQEAKSFVSLASPPQVIVSDFRLAEEANGIDAIAAIRALAGRDIPACLMSGDTDGGLMRMAGHAGLTLLHKPVRPAKMRSLLRRLLESATGREKQ